MATKSGRIVPMPLPGRYSDCRAHFVWLSNGARCEASTRWIQLEEPGLRACKHYNGPFELFEEHRISHNLQEEYKKPEAQIMAAEVKGTNK